MIEVFFRATPWALPGVLLSAVVMVFLAPLAALRLRTDSWIAWLYGTTVLGYASVTMTPSHGSGLWGGPQAFSLNFSLPRLSELTTLNSDSLNVVLGLVLGVSTAVVALKMDRIWPIVASVSLIFGAEIIQGLLPVLGRSGFLLDDVLRNFLGLALGLLLGALLTVLVKRVARSGSPSTVG